MVPLEGAPGAGLAVYSALAGLLDPLQGVLAGIPGWAMGVGRTDGWDTPQRRSRGLAIILGGIEGPSIHQRRMATGLLRGGWPGAVVVHPWNDGVPLWRCFTNLMSTAHQDRQADDLAALIRRHQRMHAGTRVCLLAQSGGCLVAVRALERLGESEQIHAAVLLAAAMSRGYDLSRAAANCAAGLFSIRGPADWFLLGLGTLLLGTSDRRFEAAAGWRGFRTIPAGFREITWRREWVRLGYLGNHISSGSPAFVAAVVAPLFTA